MNHFQLIVVKRIDDHKAAEAKRLEAEREKIRQEETAKAETEARVRIEAEQREQAEARARQDREEQTVENKRIAVELAEMEARLQADKRAASDRERAVQDKADGIKRAEEALRQESFDTDQLVLVLYERIKNDAKYAKIAKAIDGYFAKRKAA